MLRVGVQVVRVWVLVGSCGEEGGERRAQQAKYQLLAARGHVCCAIGQDMLSSGCELRVWTWTCMDALTCCSLSQPASWSL